MVNTALVEKEIKTLPEESLNDLLQYIYFLKIRNTNLIPDTALLSENILSKDWLKSEEEEIWKNL